MARDPHRDQPVLVSGARFDQAAGALILGMAQSINDDELAFARSMLDAVLAGTIG